MRFSKETTYLPHLLGDKAETVALHYLEQQGLQLIEQNFSRQPFGEIDLIMSEKNMIVFVEVRFRSYEDFVNAVESITKQKRQRLIRIATIYLTEKKLMYKTACRFDVITLDYKNKGFQLNWFKNAFEVTTR